MSSFVSVSSAAPVVGADLMRPIFVLSRSLLGAGICFALEHMTNWEIERLSTQDPEAIATLAQLNRPAVTIVEATDDVFHLFDQLGPQRIRALGMLVAVSAVARDEETLFRLAVWGIAAYLSTTTSLEDFVATIEQVRTGVYFLSEASLDPPAPPFPRQCRSKVLKGEKSASLLTTCETTVLLCVANGMFNKEIARRLDITERTVKNHLTACFKKLGVRSRSAAVVAAFRQGWIVFPGISSATQQDSASIA